MNINIVLARYNFCSQLWRYILKKWKGLGVLEHFIDEILRKFSLSPFLFVFSFSTGSSDGFPHILLLELSLLVDAGCSASRNTDVGDVGVAELEKLVDWPGITKGS